MEIPHHPEGATTGELIVFYIISITRRCIAVPQGLSYSIIEPDPLNHSPQGFILLVGANHEMHAHLGIGVAMKNNPLKTLLIGLILFAAIMAGYYLARSFRGSLDNAAVKISGEQLSQQESELIALLSLKYNLEDDVIRKMIREYNANQGDKKSAILEICRKYHVNQEVAAEIILRYKDWMRSSGSLHGTPESPDDDWDKWIRWDK